MQLDFGGTALNDIDEYEGMLWHLVRKFTSRDKTISADDLIQEAQIAAIAAISRYDSNKKASRKTFIYECVSNRLKDVCNRKVMVQASTTEWDLEAIGGEYTLDDVEFDLTMRSLLSEMEYKVYFKTFVQDKSSRDVAEDLNVTKYRVEKCLQHILHKFTSIVESRNNVLTQLRHQESWLASSPL